MVDRCVCCGEVIPEGSMVCPNCLVCHTKPSVCDDYCKCCHFVVAMATGVFMCSYLEKTGERRPCPAGTGCTVRVVDRRKKYKKRSKHRKAVNNGKE